MIEFLFNNIDYLFTIILYTGIAGLVIFFSYAIKTVECSSTKFLCQMLLFLTYLIPAVLRYDIGADYSAYEIAYNQNNNYFSEIGYVTLCNILHHYNLPSWHLFFWMSFITYFPLAFLIKEKNYIINISYILFMCYFKSYDQIRQACSMTYLILSFQNFNEKNYFRVMLDIVFATLFHQSSLVILLVYVLAISIKKETIIRIISFLLITFVVLGYLKKILLSVIEKYLPIYAHYLDSIYSQEANMGSGLGVLLSILFPIIFLLIPNMQKKDPITLWASSLYIVFRLGTVQFSILGRISDLMLAGAFYSFYYVKSYNTKYRKLIYILYYFVGFLLFFKWITSQTGIGTSEITPYKSILGK